MKKIRIRDQYLLDFVKTLPCIICLKIPSDPDHVTTRGAGGGDTANNVWPLCREHHNERHNKGLSYMIEKYSSCTTWLQLADRQDILLRHDRRKYENKNF